MRSEKHDSALPRPYYSPSSPERKQRPPMDLFTPTVLSPREETLKFIRAFARLYSAERDNEAEARRAAKAQAYPHTALYAI